MPEPQNSDEAISAAGAGGATDLAMSEGVTLENPKDGGDGGPRNRPAVSGPMPGATCAATRSSSSRA